ncbi:HAD-IC family P-type ATPase [Microbacterium keratanolyticum]
MSAPVATSPDAGLTAADVADRIARGETNAYDADTSRSAWNIVRSNVFTLFNGIVFACFFVLFLVGRWQDALFGFAAFGNAIIGCIQEFRAKAALDRLALLSAAPARVRRDGAEIEVPPNDVVLDDTLILRAGDQVPADAEVSSSRGLQIDESMLTGESDPVDKRPGELALSGSIVVGGEGVARVSRVGADSYANRFAGEARKFSLVASELRSSVNRVLTWVSWGIGPIGLLVFNAQVIVAGGYEAAFATGTWVQAVVNTIAALTAMVPLGLVLMTSIAFAVGAAKLARQQVLVNELPAVEGLARVDIICLDKTGTLTLGEIVFDDAHPLSSPEDGWEGALGWYGSAPDANATARALRSRFVGDAASRTPAQYVPFSSARKWSAVSFVERSGTWVLGAPEMVFGDLATSESTALGAEVIRLAETGRRTLVLAYAPASLDERDAEAERLPADLSPVTVLTFREQVRPDAARTLEYFRRQGVGVRIISGDSPRTVAAIAREVGLDAADGFDARELPEDLVELARVLDEHTVFGRVTPEQKKLMVSALQQAGHTVAMTGDGVNDALAIKSADIGIAMNSGSPATKAVARLVLLDGQFSHLPDVVAEGRQVIANIERVSMLFLTKTVYATGLALLFGVLLLEFPFLPRQLSITDGLTIGIPAFFLALLPNAQRYVPGFLRRSLSFAIPAGIIVAVGITAYTLAARDLGISQEQLRTGATIILAVVGIWVLSVLARPLSAVKIIVVGAMFLALIGVFTLPLSTQFFALVDPGRDAATLVAAIAILMVCGIEIVRLVHRRVLRGMAAAPAVTSDATGPTGRRARRSLVATTVARIVTLVVLAHGLLTSLLGVLLLLDRYSGADDAEVVALSLVGAGITLFGLFVVAVSGGVLRGSRPTRVLITIYATILALLGIIGILAGDAWDVWAIISVVVSAAIASALWIPPVASIFATPLEASTPQGGHDSAT